MTDTSGSALTLAQGLKNEDTLLSCKMMDNAIKGKTFTMEEAQELHRIRRAMIAQGEKE